MFNILLITFGVAFIGLFVVPVWSHAFQNGRRGEPLVAREEYAPVPWGFIDIALAVGCWIALSLLATTLVDTRFGVTAGTPSEAMSVVYYRWQNIALATVSIVTFLVVGTVIVRRCNATISDLGFDVSALWRDIKLGGAAFVLLAPPVYALQWLLVQWFVSEHPVIVRLKEHPDPGLIAASVFSAVIVAPVFEEFLFRGLLQGWLEKLFDPHDAPVDLLMGEPRSRPSEIAERDVTIDAPPVIHSDDDAPGTPWLATWLPILTSAGFFALLHLQHGPDWVPLFVLAVGLGYLYRQTHRLLPCIVVHFLLNGCSMGMFILGLLRS